MVSWSVEAKANNAVPKEFHFNWHFSALKKFLKQIGWLKLGILYIDTLAGLPDFSGMKMATLGFLPGDIWKACKVALGSLTLYLKLGWFILTVESEVGSSSKKWISFWFILLAKRFSSEVNCGFQAFWCLALHSAIIVLVLILKIFKLLFQVPFSLFNWIGLHQRHKYVPSGEK